MLRRPLPDDLGPVFSSRRARAAGVSAGRLAARDLEAPFFGIRRVRGTVDEDATPERRVREQAAAYAESMGEHEFFCGLTAAVLWEIPLPPLSVDPGRIEVGVLSPHRAPRGRGVRGVEVDARLVSVRTLPLGGVRLTSPATTWAMLGARLRHPYDLVAAGDAVLRRPQHPNDPTALATVDELADAVAAGRRVGVIALREALPRVRDWAASRPESWLRLTLVDAGLPEPDLNIDVRDATGRWIARVDLAYLSRRVVIEYEGEHHLHDARQWARDIDRADRLADAGWRVIRVTKQELFTAPGAMVARIRRALA